MEPRIRVSALLARSGKILLCRHEKGGREYWLLPGGGVHGGAGRFFTLTSGNTATTVIGGVVVDGAGIKREGAPIDINAATARGGR